MKRTKPVTVPVSHGKWTFRFELTLEQAFGILNARVRETVKLNGTREQVYVQDNKTLKYTMAANFLACDDGSTSEGLQREVTLSTLRKMIACKAWDSDEEA